jgi:hypothetical protein
VGGDRGAFDGEDFPPKPKRMRSATYRRLEEQYQQLQSRLLGLMNRFGITHPEIAKRFRIRLTPHDGSV